MWYCGVSLPEQNVWITSRSSSKCKQHGRPRWSYFDKYLYIYKYITFIGTVMYFLSPFFSYLEKKSVAARQKAHEKRLHRWARLRGTTRPLYLKLCEERKQAEVTDLPKRYVTLSHQTNLSSTNATSQRELSWNEQGIVSERRQIIKNGGAAGQAGNKSTVSVFLMSAGYFEEIVHLKKRLLSLYLLTLMCFESVLCLLGRNWLRLSSPDRLSPACVVFKTHKYTLHRCCFTDEQGRMKSAVQQRQRKPICLWIHNTFLVVKIYIYQPLARFCHSSFCILSRPLWKWLLMAVYGLFTAS